MIKPLFLYYSSLDNTYFAAPNGGIVYGFDRMFSYQKFGSKCHEPKGKGEMENFNTLREY